MYKSEQASVLFRIEGESQAMAIPCLGDASLSSSMDIDTRNCLGSSTPQKTAMSMDWNMSFSGIADISEEGAQERLFAAYKKGKKIHVVIIYQEEPVIDGYEGSVVISDWSVSLSAPGVAELSFTGQGASELFLVHENSLGPAVTILNESDMIADAEEILIKKTPKSATATYAVEPAQAGDDIAGITMEENLVMFTQGVANGTRFKVVVTLTSGSGDTQLTATDEKIFTVTGQDA